MNQNVEDLFSYIGQKNVFQKKYLDGAVEGLSETEQIELNNILVYFLETNSLEYIGDAYLLFLNDTIEETKYYVRNGTYRYSTFQEVADKVYFRKEYMNQYMIGLQLSGYIWKNHLQIHRWFLNKLETFAGNKYLEIGPGHGQYFLEAVNLQHFQNYIAIDISESSCKLTSDWCNRFRKNGFDNYDIIEGDFLNYKFDHKIDAVCMSEVLEHLEEPEKHLQQIFNITNKDANIYISVPINAPAIDHIYLFHNIDEVFELVNKVGFIIKDYICSMGNDKDYQQAIRKKSAINLAMHLIKK